MYTYGCTCTYKRCCKSNVPIVILHVLMGSNCVHVHKCCPTCRIIFTVGRTYMKVTVKKKTDQFHIYKPSLKNTFVGV